LCRLQQVTLHQGWRALEGTSCSRTSVVKSSPMPVKTLTWPHFLHVATAWCNIFAVATTKLQCKDVLTLTSLYPHKVMAWCPIIDWCNPFGQRKKRCWSSQRQLLTTCKMTLMTLNRMKKRRAMIWMA
jgi:hypothetical protein